MHLNFIATALAGLIPLILGFIWYNNRVFGKAWMAENNFDLETLRTGNMVKILGLTVVFGMFLALAINFMVVHQYHLYSILANEPGMKEEGSELSNYVKDFMSKYGSNFRTFKHGMFHGIIGGLTIAMPILAINALFERRTFRYVAIHAGYWALTIGLMGGVICAFQ